MYVTNKHLSRRAVLRGMGATVALPFLEAMVPARKAWAASGTDHTRLVCIEMVHGAAGSNAIGIEKNLWSPAAEGSDFDLTPSSLSPLEPYRKYLTIVSNTDSRMAEAFSRRKSAGITFARARCSSPSNIRSRRKAPTLLPGRLSISSTRSASVRTRPSRRCSFVSRTSTSRAGALTAMHAFMPTPSAGRRRQNRFP